MLTERIRKAKDHYINTKPAISIERARIWTESHQRTEGQPIAIRRAQAFYDTCNKLGVHIFDGELIVGASGEFRKCGILTPEFSWTWVDKEMDHFSERVQDPYEITEAQRAYLREHIFPYWKGQSLEETFLAQMPKDLAKIAVDTGIVDNDSKWRQAVGEITPDYQDVLFQKGYAGILKELEEAARKADMTTAEGLAQKEFCTASILAAKGIIRLAERYAEKAESLAHDESDEQRQQELLEIARICRKVPKNPPETFQEALQFIWFVQLGAILSENPLALNPGRFDQYMYPYYQVDIEQGLHTEDEILELIECYWLKLSEWVWTISANTADFFAGYNQFQNLTVGGRTVEGEDATNPLSYLALKATAELQTHQPGLSVRLHQDAPQSFLNAVVDLVSLGTGFPAIHNDDAGYKMLINAGYAPDDARDWSNCGCVVPHSRKTHEWTSAVNINFPAALEYASNAGKSRITGEKLGLSEKTLKDYDSYEALEKAFFKEFDHLIDVSVTSTILAQKLHSTMVPRPFLSLCNEGCLENLCDLTQNGARYNIGPVLTGIGLSVVANSLAAIKKLVFDEQRASLAQFEEALNANWKNHDILRHLAVNAPKYGNDDDYVDAIARKVANHYYRRVHEHKDFNGNPFLSAFMGISNYLPTGKVIGATPCGRRAKEPISEGVSPYAGTDQSTPLAAMRSAAKLNQEIHSGGTLLNLRLTPDLIETSRGKANIGAMIQAFFALGAFHIQFNTLSTETLRAAQEKPDEYRDLLVRVAGYSTQFVNLSRSMQESIIARNAHQQL